MTSPWLKPLIHHILVDRVKLICMSDEEPSNYGLVDPNSISLRRQAASKKRVVVTDISVKDRLLSISDGAFTLSAKLSSEAEKTFEQDSEFITFGQLRLGEIILDDFEIVLKRQQTNWEPQLLIHRFYYKGEIADSLENTLDIGRDPSVSHLLHIISLVFEGTSTYRREAIFVLAGLWKSDIDTERKETHFACLNDVKHLKYFVEKELDGTNGATHHQLREVEMPEASILLQDISTKLVKEKEHGSSADTENDTKSKQGNESQNGHSQGQENLLLSSTKQSRGTPIRKARNSLSPQETFITENSNVGSLSCSPATTVTESSSSSPDKASISTDERCAGHHLTSIKTEIHNNQSTQTDINESVLSNSAKQSSCLTCYKRRKLGGNLSRYKVSVDIPPAGQDLLAKQYPTKCTKSMIFGLSLEVDSSPSHDNENNGRDNDEGRTKVYSVEQLFHERQKWVATKSIYSLVTPIKSKITSTLDVGSPL
eukprot:jgi/Galph1/208/GphlegSOOS_G5001.1